MAKKWTATQLRIDSRVYEAARKVAEAERRSINATLNLWMERGAPEGLLDELEADLAEARIIAEASR